MTKCKLCEKNILVSKSNKKFCSYICGAKYRNLLRMKETFRLTDEDKILLKRIKKENDI